MHGTVCIVDLSHPLSTLAPGLEGAVLEVLARATEPLSGRAVRRRLSREASQSGVQKALDRLCIAGLVKQRPNGRAILNQLNRDHALAPFVVDLVQLGDTMPSRIAEVIRPHLEDASKALLFGSLARWQADAESDIDLILVWPDDTDKDPWEAKEDISDDLMRFTGNPCNTMVFTDTEFEEQCAPWLERAPDFPELPRVTLNLLDKCQQYQRPVNIPRMTRGGPRRRPCDGTDAASRVREAETFAAHAEVDPFSEVPEDRSTAVSIAVMAGVAAADAICCKALGEHSAGPDHKDAVDMLKEVPDIGEDASGRFRTLIDLKPKAMYGVGVHPSMSETKRAMRAMRSLIRMAHDG